MVLQRPLAVAVCLLTLATACGKGPGPSGSTPPQTAGGTAPEVEPRSSFGEDGGTATELRPADEEELHVDGVRLRLQPAECLLATKLLDEEQEHQFPSFPGPCHFAPDRQGGQPWVVATENGKAVLVSSSATTENGECDTALQVVVITERGPQLSRQIQRVSACGPGPWDEMMYHVLSSDRVALGALQQR